MNLDFTIVCGYLEKMILVVILAQMEYFPHVQWYSETGANGHLYSETTCIKRPLCDVPKVSAQYNLTCIKRPPLYKGHYEVALAWPFNTGFTAPC